MPLPRLTRFWLAGCLSIAVAGCAEPPNKELSQAQGAIEAARAAGAAEYATDEFTAATETLARAHQAVAERDYRAALSHALDSSARAQAAAKAAVDGRARAQLAAGQTIGDVAATLAQVRARLAVPEARRMPAAARRRAEQAATAADAAIVAARAAVERGELSATTALDAHRQALASALDALTPPAPKGRR